MTALAARAIEQPRPKVSIKDKLAEGLYIDMQDLPLVARIHAEHGTFYVPLYMTIEEELDYGQPSPEKHQALWVDTNNPVCYQKCGKTRVHRCPQFFRVIRVDDFEQMINDWLANEERFGDLGNDDGGWV